MEVPKFVIGVTGCSGVGKTTLINSLKKDFSSVTTFSSDNYYKPKAEQSLDKNGHVNFDLPSALDQDKIKNDLSQLMNGKTITQKVYGFNKAGFGDQEKIIHPSKILLIEGIFALYFPFFKKIIDYRIYLDLDQQTLLKRRLMRDITERNIPKKEVLYQWHNHVLPCFKKYVEPSKKTADMIINTEAAFGENIRTLKSIIQAKLKA